MANLTIQKEDIGLTLKKWVVRNQKQFVSYHNTEIEAINFKNNLK